MHATTATFLDPTPDGPIHEYTSIRCAPTSSDPKTICIEVPFDGHPVDEHGCPRAPLIAPGWEALLSNSRGDILFDGHVIGVRHNIAASVYTVE